MPPVRYVDVSNIWNVTHITLITQIRIIVHYYMAKIRFYQCRNRFYQCKKIDSIIVKLKHEKAFKFGV